MPPARWHHPQRVSHAQATTHLNSYTTDDHSVTNEGLGRTYTFSTTAPNRSRSRSLPNHDLP